MVAAAATYASMWQNVFRHIKVPPDSSTGEVSSSPTSSHSHQVESLIAPQSTDDVTKWAAKTLYNASSMIPPTLTTLLYRSCCLILILNSIVNVLPPLSTKFSHCEPKRHPRPPAPPDPPKIQDYSDQSKYCSCCDTNTISSGVCRDHTNQKIFPKIIIIIIHYLKQWSIRMYLGYAKAIEILHECQSSQVNWC